MFSTPFISWYILLGRHEAQRICWENDIQAVVTIDLSLKTIEFRANKKKLKVLDCFMTTDSLTVAFFRLECIKTSIQEASKFSLFSDTLI